VKASIEGRFGASRTNRLPTGVSPSSATSVPAAITDTPWSPARRSAYPGPNCVGTGCQPCIPRWPLPGKAAVAADMLCRPYMTQSGHLPAHRVARAQSHTLKPFAGPGASNRAQCFHMHRTIKPRRLISSGFRKSIELIRCKVAFFLLRPRHIFIPGWLQIPQCCYSSSQFRPPGGLGDEMLGQGWAIHAKRHPCQLSLSSTMTATS
jgi:hypothetical protein